MGVLQRIALSYGIASVLVLTLSRRMLMFASAGILLLYWGLLNWFSVPGGDPYGIDTNAMLSLDRWIYGVEVDAALHIDHWLYGDSYFWHGNGFHFDSEGLLGTLPSIVSVIFGWMSGWLMTFRSRQKGLLLRDLFYSVFYSESPGLLGAKFSLSAKNFGRVRLCFTQGASP